MKKIYRYFHKLSFLLAILAIWSLLSAVVLIAVDIQTSLAAIALLIFILMISITRPFPPFFLVISAGWQCGLRGDQL